MIIDNEVCRDVKKWMDNNPDIPEGWIYLGNEKERYVLGQPGDKNILVFGVNPSTAVAGKDDSTLRKVRSISQHDGFDGWIMVNLYPLVSTDPDLLPEVVDNNLVENNIKILEAVVKSYYIDRIWAAWGNIIDKRMYLGESLYDIQEVLCCIDAEWYYRGSLTKSGNPRHPLYMKKDEKFNWFPVADYAAVWNNFRHLDIADESV